MRIIGPRIHGTRGGFRRGLLRRGFESFDGARALPQTVNLKLHSEVHRPHAAWRRQLLLGSSIEYFSLLKRMDRMARPDFQDRYSASTTSSAELS